MPGVTAAAPEAHKDAGAAAHRVEEREDRTTEAGTADVSEPFWGSRDMRRKKEYDATLELGVPVTLIDAVLEDENGDMEIPDIDMLLATIAVARVLVPIQMVGAELRFLRHVLRLTGAEFAREIGLSDKTVVSRWENDKARPGSYTEKVVRQLVLNVLGRRAPGVDVGENAIPGMRIRLRATSEGPLAMSFGLERRVGSEGRSIDYYAEAA